jgi:hypothetical protein
MFAGAKQWWAFQFKIVINSNIIRIRFNWKTKNRIVLKFDWNWPRIVTNSNSSSSRL